MADIIKFSDIVAKNPQKTVAPVISVDSAFEQAIENNLQKVLILGIDNIGDFLLTASDLDTAECVYFLERAKLMLMKFQERVDAGDFDDLDDDDE